jgi:hypothetical protein
VYRYSTKPLKDQIAQARILFIALHIAAGTAAGIKRIKPARATAIMHISTAKETIFVRSGDAGGAIIEERGYALNAPCVLL